MYSIVVSIQKSWEILVPGFGRLSQVGRGALGIGLNRAAHGTKPELVYGSGKIETRTAPSERQVYQLR